MHRTTQFTRVGLVALLAASASAQIVTKTLSYTRFSGPPNNVMQVVLTYDAGLGTVALATPTVVTTTPGADGILFAPDGDLIIGGQGDALHKVVVSNGSFTTVTAGGTSSFHVMLDPSGTKVWSAGNPGLLATVPLNPFANGTYTPVNGDDFFITHMVFTPTQAFYTVSFPDGMGNFGRIDLSTMTTTRLHTNVPWAHGMAFDCFTEQVVVFGGSFVAQIDPSTGAIVSLLDITPVGPFQLDQGASDGNGRLYIASNTGHLIFLDISATNAVGSPFTFVATPFLDSFLDDIAPDCGLGSPPNGRRSQGYWKTHPSAWPVTTLTLGCQSYTQAECLALMRTPVKGDASLILAYQLIAAKLNVANNAQDWPQIVPVIDQADALLCNFPGRLPLGKNLGTAGLQMKTIASVLEAYNTL